MAQFEEVMANVSMTHENKEIENKYYEVKLLIADVLNIPVHLVKNIQPFGGLTNINYRATIGGKDYVVRVPGKGTEGMINRTNEKENAEFGYDIGINVHQLYFNETTGVKITKLIENAETLSRQTAGEVGNMKLVADVFKKLHQSEHKLKNCFNVFDEIILYEKLINEKNGHYLDGYQDVRQDLFTLKDYYEAMQIEITPCHIDPVAGNLVKNGHNKMYLIDWEYSGMSDPLWDVGAYIAECGLSPEEADVFLMFYFEREPTIEERKRILLNNIFQDFLWSIWSLVKEVEGEDIVPDGEMRLNRAKNNIANFFQMMKAK